MFCSRPRGATWSVRGPPPPGSRTAGLGPAHTRRTVGIRMTLPATGKLVRQCEDHTEVCSCIHLKCLRVLPGCTKPCRTHGGYKKTCLFPPKIIMCYLKTQYKILRHLRWIHLQEQTSVLQVRLAIPVASCQCTVRVLPRLRGREAFRWGGGASPRELLFKGRFKSRITPRDCSWHRSARARTHAPAAGSAGTSCSGMQCSGACCHVACRRQVMPRPA